jgi:mRNA interferase MazF
MVGEPPAPEPGRIVWLDFSPTARTEQAGRRPALVLSDHGYNERSGRAVVAPITSRVRGWAFEVALPDDFEVQGVVLADQLRTVDWRARGARLAATVPGAVLEEARAKVGALIGLG